ncbi:hypothetical protein PR048_000192 [Dryococelus australis]|uniref:Uncharacterized protein n=1 Tax=Dryococelus australis TaxID=614101 RepID=A0ABQ9IDZ3_9NEOP|nr:hypothetical protein PR048_000192 [Dryococelus australis]
MGKCSFRNDWLDRKDDNGYIVREWRTEMIIRYIKRIVKKLSPSQLRLSVVRPSSATGVNKLTGGIVQIYSVKDKATAVELHSTMKCVISNSSFLSCDGIGELFVS